MKKLELWLNIVLYCLFKWQNYLFFLMNKVNPFRLLNKLPSAQRRYKKQGVNIDKVINDVLNNPINSMSKRFAGGFLFALVFFLQFGIVNFFFKIIKYTGPQTVIYFVVYGLICIITMNSLMFKKAKYLIYFKKFEGWTRKEKITYSLWNLLAIIAVFALNIIALS
jgi:hypothetical protein